MTTTQQSREVLRFIVESWEAGGPMPSHRSTCLHFGWKSTNAAAIHFDRLEVNGAIRREKMGAMYGIVLDHPDVVAVRSELAKGRVA